MPATFHDQLLTATHEFMARHKMTPNAFGIAMRGNSALYGRILGGKMQIDTADAVMAAMNVHDAKAKRKKS